MEKYLTPIAVIVGAIIIGFAFYFGHGGAPAAQTGTQGAAVAVDIKDIQTDGEPYLGNPNAPVTIAFFYDYQCPFCKQFEETVTPQLYDAYVKSGKLKIVLKDFQFLGEDSTTAALFGRAVWEAYPDHYYDWYKAMFAAQDDEGDKGFGDLDSIKKLTATVPGIDVNKVVTLMNSKQAQYQAAIQADYDESVKLGVNATPSVLVGTKLIPGGGTFAAISALVDAELKK